MKSPDPRESVEYGLAFSGEMVRAILAGSKTVTRRLVKLPTGLARLGGDLDRAWPGKIMGVTPGLRVPCQDGTIQRLRNPWGFPHAVPTRLWVREAWNAERRYDDRRPSELPANAAIWYAADNWIPPGAGKIGRYRHARFMPRRASRLLREIVDVRAERLQDITEAEAIAEGAIWTDWGVYPYGDKLPGWSMGAATSHKDCLHTARSAFANLWTRLYGVESWDASPWVWRVEFRRVEP